MSADNPTFPENRFAENHSPDPNDRSDTTTQSEDIDQQHKQRATETPKKKPRRFSRKEVEEGIPPDPDPDDPVAT